MAESDAELDELVKNFIAEQLGGREPAPPLPERWRALLNDVNAANVVGDGWPRHKIGRFDAVICCGRGTYGLVIEVFEPDLQRRCALKMCDSERQDTADVLAEARLLASLSHPNIITVYEIGSYVHRRYIPEEGRYDVEHPDDLKDPFFVMEYATGKTARHFALDCEEYGDDPPPWQKTLDIFLGAGKGLAFAHKEGTVHGDFKPSNVLIDEGGARPRVADFGFARTQLRHTPEHERDAVRVQAGTHVYAAPEALRGEECDALSDLWSFCAALWHCLEGRLPFAGQSIEQLLEAVDGTEPRRGERAVPETLRTVLECGLSIDPADRFPSMDELLQALELVRRTAVTPHVSREEQAEIKVRPPQRRRRKGRGWGPAAVAGMLVGGLSVFAAMREAARDVPPATEPTTSTGECAVEPGESIRSKPKLHEALLGVCHRIRAGEFEQANTDWDNHFRPGDSAIAEATSIVVRTFDYTANALRQRDPVGAGEAAAGAERWTRALYGEHAGLKDR